jgi:hypothetical protein
MAVSPVPGHESRVAAKSSIPGIAMELPGINKYAGSKSSYQYVYATGGNAVAALGTEVPIGSWGMVEGCAGGFLW